MSVIKPNIWLFAALFGISVWMVPFLSQAADEDNDATNQAIENVAATDAPATPCPVTQAEADRTKHPVTGKKEAGDASSPSDTHSQLILNLEWQHHELGDAGRTDTFGVRIMAKLGLTKSSFAFVEIPLFYAFNDQTTDDPATPENEQVPDKFGIGDIRIRAFYLPYQKKTIGFSGFGVSLDAYAPSGSKEYNLGSGYWVLAPGLLFEFTATKWLGIYPIISYSAVFPLAGVDPLIQSIAVQAYIVFRMPKSLFAQIVPAYSQEFSPDVFGSFNCEFVLGWQPGASGVQFHYLRQFRGLDIFAAPVDQLRIAYTYFF